MIEKMMFILTFFDYQIDCEFERKRADFAYIHTYILFCFATRSCGGVDMDLAANCKVFPFIYLCLILFIVILNISLTRAAGVGSN